MAAPQLYALIRQMRNLVRPEESSVLGDAELLARFVAQRDEAAFELLLWRHGPMVLGVCRRLLRSAEDVEDVFQATFLALARRAGSIAKREAVGSWLYKVAYRIALDARTLSGRVAAVEKHVAVLPDVESAPDASQQAAGNELQALVDAAIQRLPRKYREPVVLCHLQGKTQDEAARELGWAKGTVSTRLIRARELLRQRLQRQDESFSAFLGVLGNQSLPASLAKPTLRAVFSLQPQATAMRLASARPFVLAERVLHVITLAQWKIRVAVLLMLTSLGTAAGWLGYQARHSRSEADGFVQSATLDPAGEQSADAIRASPLGRLESSAIPPEDRFPWQPPELVAVLGEHRGRSWSSVDGIAYSPDGKQIAGYGHTFDIRLWDAATLRERAVLKQHTRQLSCLAFSPNGKILASGDHGKTLVLWDLMAAPPKVQAVLTPSEGVQGVAFSPDGSMLATSGLRTIRLWQFRGETKPEQISLLNGPQQAWLGPLLFSRDGKTLASVSRERSGDNVLFWNLQTKTFSPLLKANTGRIQSIAISPDGNNLAISHSHPKEKSWTVDLWNVAEPTRAELTASFDRQTNSSSTVRFSPDGKILAIAASRARQDGDIRLWNLTGKAPTELAVIQKLSSIDAIDFSPDGKTLVSGHSSGMIRLWELEGTKLKERFSHKGHSDAVTRLAVSATGVLVSGARDGTVRRWDLSGIEGKQIDLLNSEGDIALSRDGKTLALGNDDGTIELWDVGTKKSARRLRFQAHKKRDQFSGISSLEFSADGKTLASHGYDGKIRLWNLIGKEPTERGTIDAHASWSWSLAFSQDGTRLALSELIGASVVRPEDRPTMRVWDITGTQPREIAAVLEQAPDMAALALAPDGRTLATGGGERDLGRPSPSPISLWRLSGKEPPRRTLRLDGHLLAINFMAYSPDGQMLVSAGQTGQVILWETMTGSKYREWQLPGQVARITFADDGRHLITANENGTLYVLRLGHGVAAAADPTALWKSLASLDAARAYQAMWGMVASPRQTIALFQHRLLPAEGATEEQVGQFIDRLDDKNFAERTKASAALEKLQEQVEPALRRRLAERPSLEVRQRLERLLEEPRPVRPERLRTMRAIQILAQIGSRDSQRLLNRLAQGAPGASETQLARQALGRLMEPMESAR